MADELKIRISLDDKVFGDLKKTEDQLKQFGQRIGKVISGQIDLFGTSAQGNPTQKLEQTVNKLTRSLKSSLDEIDRSIDSILGRVDKAFDNIFVGLDNFLAIGRRWKLAIGTFLGDSRATLTTVINQLFGFFRAVGPILAGLSKGIKRNSGDIVNIIQKGGIFIKTAVGFSERLNKQVAAFGNNPKFSQLTYFLGVRDLPLLEQIRVFFEQVRRFMNSMNVQISRVIELVKFVFSVTDEQFSLLDKRAHRTADVLNRDINNVGAEVMEIMNHVEKRVSLFDRAIRSLVGTFSLLGKTLLLPITLPLKAITATFGAIKGLFVNKATPLTEQQKLDKMQDENQQRRFALQAKFLNGLKSEAEIFSQIQQAYFIDIKRTIQLVSSIQHSVLVDLRGSIDRLISATKRLEHIMRSLFDVGAVKRFGSEVDNVLNKAAKVTGGKTNLKDRVPAGYTMKSLQTFVEPPQKIFVEGSKAVRDFRKEVEEALAVLFKELATLESRGKGVNAAFLAMGNVLESKSGSIYRSLATIRDEALKLATSGNSINTGLSRALSKVNALFAEMAESGKAVAANFSETLSKGFTKAFSKIQGASIGGKISKIIASDLKSGSKDAEKAMGELSKTLAGQFPKDLAKSGEKIPQQLAEGMKKNQKVVEAAANENAEKIAGYYPQSPALFGPLQRLPMSGGLIPTQLASGMLSKISAVIDAAEKVAGAILSPFTFALGKIKEAVSGMMQSVKDTIDEANKIGDIANSTGVSVNTISKLDEVFREVGETAADNATVFSRMQQTINTVDKEQEKALRQVGINLAEIRNSGDPIVELFTSVSDVVAKSEAGSEKSRKALEALGLTIDSKVVGVLRNGGDAMRDLMSQSELWGSAINTSVVEVSQELRALFSNLKKIFSAVKADFIGEILPVIRDFFAKVVEFLNKHAVQIRNFFIAAGKFVANLINVFVAFFELLIREPKKAFQVAATVLDTFRNLADQILNKMLARIRQNITDEIKFTTQAAITGLKTSLGNIFTLLAEQVDLQIAKLLLQAESFLMTLDQKIIWFGNTFLGNTKEVFKRWIIIAGAVIKEIWISIKNFFLDVRDYLLIVVNQAKRNIEETLEKLFGSTAFKKLGKLVGADFSEGFKAVKNETQRTIDNLHKAIEKRAGGPSFFDRAAASVGEVANNLGSVDDKLDEINQKIAESQDRFMVGLNDNFSTAFKDAQILIENAKKATGGLFDKEAIEEYNLALDEAIGRIKESVEGTELADPVKRLISDLSTEYIEKMKEVKDQIAEGFGTSNLIKEDELNKTEESSNSFGNLVENIKMGIQVGGQFGDTMETIFSAVTQGSKELAIATKATALLQATVRGASAIVNALDMPPPMNLIMPPLVAAQVGAQIGVIARQSLKGYEAGGEVSGPKGSDRVHAMLTAGEFVMPLDVVKTNGLAFMEALRSGAIGARDFIFSSLPNIVQSPSNRRFESGGYVAPVDPVNLQSKEQEQDKQPVIVNVPDINMVGRFVSSQKGTNVMLNFMSDHAVEIKNMLGVG